MVDAVLFDLGDTIFNFGAADFRAAVHAGAADGYALLREAAITVPDFATYMRRHYRALRRCYFWARVSGRDFNAMDVMCRVCRTLGVTVSREQALELAWVWYRPIVEKTHVEPGVADMLEQLRSAGTKLAIVSNTCVPGHCLDRHLEHEGLLDYFPVRIYSCDVIYRKPHRRIFEIALERVGVAASRAVFIGDLLGADIRGAGRAGLRTVWKPAMHLSPVTTGRKVRRADAMVRSLTQLMEVLPRFGWEASPSLALA